MRGTLDSNFLLFDPKIEKTSRRLHKETKERRKAQLEAMENPHSEGHRGNPNNPQVRTLMDYSIPRVDGCSTISKLRTEITTFHQQEGESLSDAWECYNEILRRCPHHSFEFWIQVQSFYNGLLPHARSMVYAATVGDLNFKTPEQAWNLLEMMANNDYQRQGERVVAKKGIMEVDTLNALLAQNKIMTQQLANLSKKVESLNISVVSFPSISCDFCGGNHSSGECPENMFDQSSQEQVNYLGNPPRPQNDPFSNTYNLGWRNHPNFS
ncbi:hypothetical protein L6164_017119 [Bauhinia variegata]|uniref:Uncharacterized protein n=1 Tax=Bauhinia variegata TaxID=167791 RepID=A0ACB9N6X1_BAUVA|nr:hypothetical protein L6164_017119 [Bauhinia variegata]